MVQAPRPFGRGRGRGPKSKGASALLKTSGGVTVFREFTSPHPSRLGPLHQMNPFMQIALRKQVPNPTHERRKPVLSVAPVLPSVTTIQYGTDTCFKALVSQESSARNFARVLALGFGNQPFHVVLAYVHPRTGLSEFGSVCLFEVPVLRGPIGQWKQDLARPSASRRRRSFAPSMGMLVTKLIFHMALPCIFPRYVTLCSPLSSSGSKRGWMRIETASIRHELTSYH
ncbi:hypothetical protein NMY22_g9628 [Coprinellus aureogranulatus]|nr:hypothetical protein NMY22_g9628 [Coprinellus aureogranulatus]